MKWGERPSTGQRATPYKHNQRPVTHILKRELAPAYVRAPPAKTGSPLRPPISHRRPAHADRRRRDRGRSRRWARIGWTPIEDGSDGAVPR